METRKKFFKAGMLALMVACLPSLLMAQKEFRKWPKGCSPQEVGELVSQRFVAVPHPNFNGNPAPPNEITYPETCAWFGALRYAHITKNKKLLRQLEERFLPIFGPERRLQPLPDHVDHTVFGTTTWECGMQTNNGKCHVTPNIAKRTRLCWIRGYPGKPATGLTICL